MTQSVRSFVPWARFLGDYAGLAVALGLLVLVFSLATRHFFSPETFRTIANQIPAAVLLATGMTFVLIAGEIDLSVGSVVGLGGAVVGTTLTQWHWPLAGALAAALGTGALCGLFNGVVSQTWRLPSFIVTLGLMEMARGAAHAVTHSQTQYVGESVGRIAEVAYLGFSLPFLLALVTVVAAQTVLSKTIFGRHLFAVGGNETAARYSGLHPQRIRVAVFVLCSVLAALAAIIDTSRFQSANPNAGTGFELQAIAAAVIGGTSLLGGRGSVVRTFLGVLIIAVLNAGLAAVGAKDETKRFVTGAVIITAVVVDYYRTRYTNGRTA
jgi:ribose transport system permease protein